MKIVLTDAQTVLDDIVNADVLNQFGEVESFGLLKYEEVAEKIADADIVVCNKTLLDSHTMQLAKNLKYIGLFATGYNNIDLDYCTKNGITVCNAGSYSTNAVAQHTFALILEHFNHTAEYNRFVQDGKWKRSKTFSPFVYPLNELAGKTLGIVGLGNIGKAVAKIANAFDMNVIASSRTPKNIDGIEDVSFDELLETSDIVSVHCPLNPQSENMFDKNAFAKMKQANASSLKRSAMWTPFRCALGARMLMRSSTPLPFSRAALAASIWKILPPRAALKLSVSSRSAATSRFSMTISTARRSSAPPRSSTR